MSEITTQVPITDPMARKFFGELMFTVVRRGYDADQVVSFVERATEDFARLLGRAQQAEAVVDQARTAVARAQAQSAELVERVRAAEAHQRLFQRALSLAESTANATVADARVRAEEIIEEGRRDAALLLEQAREEARGYYEAERVKIGEEWVEIRDEQTQLETLRLAVAAETMALESVRTELRRRIKSAAEQLVEVADSDDCLGHRIVSATDGETVELRDGDPAKSFEGTWTADDDEEEHVEAFERFMSDEIENEPSQSWMLAS